MKERMKMAFSWPTPWPNGQDLVVVLMAGMMLLVPAVGVPGDLVLQDTLKSMLVSLGTLTSAALLLWHMQRASLRMHWHPVLWLPILLLVLALGSAAWSHTYLAAVEAVRWFIFAVLVWAGFSALTLERLPMLATGIHWGAVMASFWTLLQFWLDLQVFPQSPPPASTFLNRNFLSEFLVCALPYSVFVAAQGKGRWQILLRTFAASCLVLTLLMTGARAALLALVITAPVLAYVLWRFRRHLALGAWHRSDRLLAACVVMATVFGLGSVPTGAPVLSAERLGQTAIERALIRSKSLMSSSEYTDGSSSVRLAMWRATLKMILDHPIAGVGAGAWEVQAPKYQDADTQIEIDFYAHNEFLQLVAEYGLGGWIFILALSGYLLRTAARAWRDRYLEPVSAPPKALWQGILLTSLLALMVVSVAGFPWRLAGTGALFAIGLGALVALDRGADAREGVWRAVGLNHSDRLLRYSVWAMTVSLVLALGISWLAVAAETRLVRAAKLSYRLSYLGARGDPAWNRIHEEALQLARQGVAINPHYRKITAVIADNLIEIGDWTNAAWIWESLARSRPYVAIFPANLARASLHQGDLSSARHHFESAKRIHGRAPTVHSLEVMILAKERNVEQAMTKARLYLRGKDVEPDLVNLAYALGIQEGNWLLALDSQAVRRLRWPIAATDSWLKTGAIYLRPEIYDAELAKAAFQAALDATHESLKPRVLDAIPADFRRHMR